MSSVRISRQLILAAVDILKALGHSGFDRLALEWDIQDQLPPGTGSLAVKATQLAAIVFQNSDRLTPEGDRFDMAVLSRASLVNLKYPKGNGIPNVSAEDRAYFDGLYDKYLQQSLTSATYELLQDLGQIPSEVSELDSDENSSVATEVVEEKLSRKIFVVHGRDEGVREMVARFLERAKFDPIVLLEQANAGMTIIEKIEAHSNVQVAVVLLTPDDEGGLKGGSQMPRVRQNVLLELGYFVGKTGRQKTIAFMKGEVDVPTDFAGVVWTPLDEHGAWKQRLLKELSAMGFVVDWSVLK
jgi:predicted nucleotide-binding protein